MPKNMRRNDVLRILHRHGPLSNKGLKEILYPNISARRLRDITKRLYDKNLLIVRHDSLPYNSGHFYQISQRLMDRIKVGKLLGTSPESLQQNCFRSQDLIHSEKCAISAHRFTTLFPQGTVIRDYEIRKYPDLLRILLASQDDYEIMPDILLSIPATESKRHITVAIEIEKSPKSYERLLHKIKKLSTKTFLDGVIYICTRNAISEAIRQTYTNHVRYISNRTKHYGANFLLFSDGSLLADKHEPILLNTELKTVLLKDWIQFLLTTEPRLRRDSDFAFSTS